ncbi:MAG: cupin domain-containing protein [Cyanobacteria bacterium M_surface_7_m2_040]|nr:cupin domain-containing protein [Cyanobacteria bacterium M_surface_9_m1_291]MBM5828113.1 cupin domain-containing protein [Cyanobacteria bacterium M_surface_7_m2_040]
MAQRHLVEILPSQGERSGLAFFREPLTSDETLIAELEPCSRPELFCHRHQTDQLMVLRGGIDLIVLQNKCLRRIPLREDEPTWVRIPPYVPHGVINRGPSTAVVVNAVLRHRVSDSREYQPRPVPTALVPAWIELQQGLFLQRADSQH